MDIDDMYNDNYTEKCNTTVIIILKIIILRRIGYTRDEPLIAPNRFVGKPYFFLVSRRGNV
jgi:hypothetical protein